MGPIQRYLGPEVPQERLIWQDPVPAVDHELVDDADVASLKQQVLGSGLTVSQLVAAAWASASTFRSSDKRGGANGARIRLEPQSGWEANDPDQLAGVLRTLEGIRSSFNQGGKQVSLADLIVLGGAAAVEQAAKATGHDVTVPFTPGRTDATQEQTDVDSFAPLEPTADGFRNYLGKGHRVPAEYLLIDRANLLGLSAPEMTVLVGGLRVLGANAGGSSTGALTHNVGTLSNDFFVNLLDLGTTWTPTDDSSESFEARDAAGNVTWTGSRVDLVFGSNSSCARWPRSTPATTRRRSSSPTSSRRGPRSWTPTGTTSPDDGSVTFRLGFVTGATPDKWAGTWRERQREPIEVVPVTEDVQEHGVRSGALDVALVRLPVDRDGLHLIPLYDEQPVAVLNVDNELTLLDEVTTEDLVDEHQDWTGLTVREAVETVAAGTGALVVPMSVARLHHRKDVTYRTVTDLPSTQIGLTWLVENDDPRIQTFIGIVRGRSERSSRG